MTHIPMHKCNVNRLYAFGARRAVYLSCARHMRGQDGTGSICSGNLARSGTEDPADRQADSISSKQTHFKTTGFCVIQPMRVKRVCILKMRLKQLLAGFKPSLIAQRYTPCKAGRDRNPQEGR